MSDVPLPEINDRAWISFDRYLRDTYPSRVESCEGNEFYVAAPFRHIEDDERKIELLELDGLPRDLIFAWRCENGFAYMDATVKDILEGELVIWHLVVDGEIGVMQRRNFVRVPDSSEALMHIGDQTMPCVLIDLSEGGLGCSIPFLDFWEHTELAVELEVSERTMRIPVRLIRKIVTEDARLRLALEFLALSSADAAIIRRHVFGRQVELRQRQG